MKKIDVSTPYKTLAIVMRKLQETLYEKEKNITCGR